MEFKEFNDPLENDYDIKVGYRNNSNTNISETKLYFRQLVDLIGFLEADDLGDEELLREYGITVNEYFSPTAEVVQKVRERLKNSHTRNRR